MLIKHTFYAACILAVSATAAQAQQANCANLKLLSSVKMEATADGRWLVPVKLNGADKKMLLDTSTVPSALFTEYATENNMALTDALPPPPAPGAAPAGGRGAAAAMAAPGKVTEVQSFALGTLQSGKGFFKVAPDARKDRALDSNIVGVLGTDILSRQDFDLDFGAKTIGLFSSDHCPGGVVYWSGPTIALPFFVNSKDQLRITVLVDGKEMNAMLHSGVAQNGMSLVFGKRKLGFDETAAGYEKVATAEGAPAQYSHRFKSIDIGGMAINNPLVVVTDDSKTNKITVTGSGSAGRTANMDITIPDITLGTAFLNKWHLYFATTERKIYVTPAVAPTAQ